MPSQSWQQTLTSAAADGTQISNSTTQASIIPTANKFTLPANFFDAPGKGLKIIATGRMSNVVTTPGTLLFQVLFNAVAVCNPAATAINLNTAAKTNVAWWLEIMMTCRSVGTGSAATMMYQMNFTSESVEGAAAGEAITAFILPSAPIVGTGFDSTIAQTVDLQAKFSVATSPTNLTLHQYRLESLN